MLTQNSEQHAEFAVCTHQLLTLHVFAACSCFSSPIRRAASTADIMWRDRPGKLTFLDSLKEAHLGVQKAIAARPDDRHMLSVSCNLQAGSRACDKV